MICNPYVFAASGTVELLAHFNGTNGSTTFIDSSSFNWTITPFGSAQLSTTIKKFGTASLSLLSNTDYATVSYLAALRNNLDCCYECWVYPVTKFGYGNVFGHSEGAATPSKGFNLQWGYGTNKIKILIGYLGAGTWTINQTGSIDVPLNVWTHIAVTLQGQVLRVFINGVKDIEINSASTKWAEPTAGGAFCIGSATGNNRFGVGYIDEFRITSGSAVYIADFTPPTVEF